MYQTFLRPGELEKRGFSCRRAREVPPKLVSKHIHGGIWTIFGIFPDKTPRKLQGGQSKSLLLRLKSLLEFLAQE